MYICILYIILYYTIIYYTILYYIILYHIILYYIILYCVKLYYIMLYNTILYYVIHMLFYKPRLFFADKSCCPLVCQDTAPEFGRSRCPVSPEGKTWSLRPDCLWISMDFPWDVILWI